MRKTALDLVNEILQAGDSEPVSTIGETEESGQVLALLNRAYNQLLAEIDWEHRYTIVKLDTATGTNTTWDSSTYPALPWVMKLPSNVESVYQVYYKQKLINYIDRDTFHWKYINKIGLKTTGDPKVWTSLDDQYLIFDSFDASAENQLSSANSEAMVVKFPGTDLAADSDAPAIPDRFYGALIQKALQFYFLEIESNATKASMARSEYAIQRSALKKWARRNKGFVPYYAYFDFSKRWPSANIYRPDTSIIDKGPA